VLLVWIGHAIFSSEAESAVRATGEDWLALGWQEQWRAAWTIGPQQLWRTLTLVRFEALALSLVFMGTTLFLGVWRWRMVLRVQGLELPFGRALEISLIAQFFNAFLLGSTGGDLMKAYVTARETHHKKTQAVVTVLADRLIGLFAMLLFAGVMMLANLHFLLEHRELSVVVWVVVAMLGGCGMFLVLAFWGGVSRAVPSARAWLRRLPKADLIEQAIEAFRHFGRDPAFLVRAFGVSVLLNLACVFQLMALGAGLGIEVPWLVWFVIVPTIICISALPITPSGLGVRENLYVLTLAGAGLQVPATQALAVSLLAYFGFLVWSLIGGVVYLSVRERRHLDEVARESRR
jgi:uncharacterized protein (TIRG00374 family)